MIIPAQYFGNKVNSPDCTQEIQIYAEEVLLPRVNNLLDAACQAGVYNFEEDPDTGTQISGSKGGAGDGGFRLSTSSTGAPNSKHKRGQAVDVYDPDNALDNWLDDAKLEMFGLYREHPDATPGWCHLQSEPPGSGHHTFRP